MIYNFSLNIDKKMGVFYLQKDTTFFKRFKGTWPTTLAGGLTSAVLYGGGHGSKGWQVGAWVIAGGCHFFEDMDRCVFFIHV